MSKWTLALTTAVAWAGLVQAQPYQPVRPNYSPSFQPGLSPYLNLLRGGDPASNYYLGVVPEFQRRANTAQFRNALQDLEQQVYTGGEPDNVLSAPTSATGHAAAFLNTGTYFGNLNTPRIGPVGASGFPNPRRR
jgi:hypothetical protein